IDLIWHTHMLHPKFYVPQTFALLHHATHSKLFSIQAVESFELNPEKVFNHIPEPIEMVLSPPPNRLDQSRQWKQLWMSEFKQSIYHEVILPSELGAGVFDSLDANLILDKIIGHIHSPLDLVRLSMVNKKLYQAIQGPANYE